MSAPALKKKLKLKPSIRGENHKTPILNAIGY